ncbi:hypothetical protein BGZ73_008717 [Actinomortierella ambigua]|nr:hypothetical protein BGZ73_008717 [Actinomortierella ambigua]
MTGTLDLEYPELLKQWTQNFAWSMGLVEIRQWSEIIKWLRDKTNRKKTLEQEPEYEFDRHQRHQQHPSHPLHPSSAQPDLKFGHRQPLSYNNTELQQSTTDTSNTGNNSASPITSLLGSFSARPWMSPHTIAFLKHLHVNSTGLTVHLATRLDRRQDDAASTDVHVSTHQPGEALLPSSDDPNVLHAWPELSILDPRSNNTNIPSSSDLGGLEDPKQELEQMHMGTIQPSGLHSFGDHLQIPAKDMFMTSLFAFLSVIALISLVAIVARGSLELYAYYRPGKFAELRQRFLTYYAGHLLRVGLLGFLSVSTLAFYQLTLDDTWPIMLLAAFTLLVFVSMVVITTVRLRRAGSKSLFVDGRLMAKYGPLYDQYTVSTYLFFLPVFIYQFTKAALVGLGQSDPYDDNRRHAAVHLIDHGRSAPTAWIQTILMLLLEVAFAGILIWRRPYAEVMPYRLNAVMSVLRVINMMLLTVLLEGASSSIVSRATVGVAITVLQALILAVLAILVLSQLGRSVWRLSGTLKMVAENAKKEAELPVDRKSKILLEEDEEVLVVCVNDDSDEGDTSGRNAMDLPRLSDTNFSNSSISTLVGQMGFGTSSTLEYTLPAGGADIDDNDSYYPDHSDYHQDSPCRPRPKILMSTSDKSPGSMLSRTDSTSSGILDYYNPAYLPISIRDNYMSSQAIFQPGLDTNQRHNERDTKELMLTVPLQAEVPWVQSAYMTRRKSESNVPPHPFAQNESKKTPGESSITLTDSSMNEEDELDKIRWRPRSLGGSALLRAMGNSSSSSLSPPIHFDFVNSIPNTLHGPPPSPPRDIPLRVSPTVAALIPTAAAFDSSPSTPIGNDRGAKQEVSPGDDRHKCDDPDHSDEESPHPLPPLSVRIAALMAYCFPDEAAAYQQPGSKLPVPNSPCPYVLTPIHPLSPMFREGYFQHSRHNSRLKPVLSIDTKAPPAKKRASSLCQTTAALAFDVATTTTKAPVTPSAVPALPPQIPLPAVPQNSCYGTHNGSHSSLLSMRKNHLKPSMRCSSMIIAPPAPPSSWSSSALALSTSSLPQMMASSIQSGRKTAGSSGTGRLPAAKPFVRRSVVSEIVTQMEQQQQQRQHRREIERSRGSVPTSVSPPARRSPTVAKTAPFSPVKHPKTDVRTYADVARSPVVDNK